MYCGEFLPQQILSEIWAAAAVFKHKQQHTQDLLLESP